MTTNLARGSPPRARTVLTILCLAQFMVVLDASIVNVALPPIGAALALPASQLSLVVSSYALFFGALLMLGGRLGDRFGRRRVFVLGLLAFAAASLLGGLAWSGPVLVAARAVQGAAAAVLTPSVLALITTNFAEGRTRNRALGVFGAVAAVGFSAGVLLGGVLVQFLGWRSVLFVNVPIGLAAAVIAPRVIPVDDRAHDTRLDLPGTLTATIGLAALVHALTRAPETGWTAPETLVSLTVAVVGLVAFTMIEQRAARPLLRPGLVTVPGVAGANLIVLLFAATMISTLFVLTLYLQDTVRYSPVMTGLALLPHALLVVGLSPIVSRIADRYGPFVPMTTGSVMLIGGLVLLRRIGHADHYASVVLPGTLLLGVGVAAITVAGAVAATSGVASTEQGVASGLINTSQQLGGALGLAALSSVIGGSADAVAGDRGALTIGIASAAAALLISLTLCARARVVG